MFSCGDKEKPIEPPQEVPVEGIAVTPEKIFLVAGKTQELAAIVATVTNATNTAVKWMQR